MQAPSQPQMPGVPALLLHVQQLVRTAAIVILVPLEGLSIRCAAVVAAAAAAVGVLRSAAHGERCAVHNAAFNGKMFGKNCRAGGCALTEQACPTYHSPMHK